MLALLNIVDAVTFFFLYYIYSTEQLLSCSLKQKECGECFNYQLDVAVTAKRSPFSPTGPEWCAEELAVWVVLCRSAATRENHLAVPLRDPAEDQPVRALLRATQCCSSSLTVESHRRLFFSSSLKHIRQHSLKNDCLLNPSSVTIGTAGLSTCLNELHEHLNVWTGLL